MTHWNESLSSWSSNTLKIITMYNLSVYFLYKVTCTRIWQQSMSARGGCKEETGPSPRYDSTDPVVLHVLKTGLLLSPDSNPDYAQWRYHPSYSWSHWLHHWGPNLCWQVELLVEYLFWYFCRAKQNLIRNYLTQAAAQQTDLPTHQCASFTVPVDEVRYWGGYDQVCVFVNQM